jgi:hypothetical protein
MTERSLASGFVTPSTTALNIGDEDGAVKELRAVTDSIGTRTVALGISDLAATMAVFPFESLPSGNQERNAILKWRFEHEVHASIGDARIVSQVFPVPAHKREAVLPAAHPEHVTAYVLAVAIKPRIMQQYHRLCARAGLLPVSIGVTSLQVFDCLKAGMSASAEHQVMIWTPDSSTYIGLRFGIPIYLRSKRRRSDSDIRRELMAARQFFADRFPPVGQDGDSPVYLIRPSDAGGTQENGKDEQQTTTDLQSCPFDVVPLSLTSTGGDPRRCIVSWGGLCAFASAASA